MKIQSEVTFVHALGGGRYEVRSTGPTHNIMLEVMAEAAPVVGDRLMVELEPLYVATPRVTAEPEPEVEPEPPVVEAVEAPEPEPEPEPEAAPAGGKPKKAAKKAKKSK